ncbi:MAG: family 16 glycoside hydrolase [Pseudomonadota bacterium]|nr:family 16 glycoside hydrolase [Pseudomonadota bacterium]
MSEIDLNLDDLIPNDVEATIAFHNGYDAIRLVLTPDAETPDNPTFARIDNLEFHNGIIEVEVAGRPLPEAIPEARGFIGIAFRIQDDLSAFECMYIRPTNGRAEQQLRRNRASQYFSYPDWKFDRLRTEVPGHYEAYVDLETGAWTKMRIEVMGDRASLFVHDNDQPTIIVNDLKHGAEMKGSIGLYIDNGTEGFFKNLKVANS